VKINGIEGLTDEQIQAELAPTTFDDAGAGKMQKRLAYILLGLALVSWPARFVPRSGERILLSRLCPLLAAHVRPERALDHHRRPSIAQL
jgi:hypothetical protein